MVLSSDAVTMRDPSGLKAAEFTPPSWPRRTAISLTLAASQMRAVLSHDAVTMRDPSRLKEERLRHRSKSFQASPHFRNSSCPGLDKSLDYGDTRQRRRLGLATNSGAGI